MRSGRSSRPRHHRVLYCPHRRLWIMECSCKVWCRPCRRRPTPRLHSRLSWRLRQEGEMEQYLEEKKASQKRPATTFQQQDKKKVVYQTHQRSVAVGSTQTQDEGVIEPLPGTHYDILKHLDHVPAKISILELIKKSNEHQEALRNFLQKVVVNEDMLADKLPSALAMVTRGPAITFAENELEPPEARRLPLCVTLVINHVAVGAALVDTGASINVCPLSTLRACDVSEGMLRPTPTTIAAYDSSIRSCHGMVTVQAELGPLTVSVDLYVLDIDPMYKAILGRPWLEALGAVPSTAHQCLKFPFQGRIIKVKSVTTAHSVDAIHDTHLPAVWPANKAVVSVMDVNYPWSYSFQSKRETNPAQVNAVKRKETLSTKGWQIMMKLGYEEGKGLGGELQGIVKPIPDIVKKSRWGLGYKERGPTQPGYNTVVVEAELSQHEVHGRNVSRHMAPLLTYRALEALRPGKRRKTGDPEAEWYRWFDIEDITVAFSRLF
ncbi:hypothetical protein Taro_054149 [Colocasia esculenta]|uniref:G-patch domain-containing protein n=1 Tax=Colocasia esculenta TaxID=4460 RepID=A0A843XQ82_COLES|nr:hypothetical protein [Colocasia esculenta]